jgi:glycosyltransferase involved in cell wall biosynthesis
MTAARVLLVAYQCGPGMGSVSQLGWEWYARLSRERPVTLVTHVRNRAALEAAGAPLPGSEVRYIDTEWLAGPLYRTARRLFPRSEHSVFLVASFDYFAFDYAAFRQLRRAVQAGELDATLVHRVTPVTTAAPTWLGRLGLPLIVGPLNSGLRDPRGFDGIMRAESTWLIRARRLGRVFDHLIGSTRRARRILVASRATLDSIGKRYHANCRTMLENGVDLERFDVAPWPPAPIGRPLRVLFVGRLVPVKGLDMLLRAVAQVRSAGQAIHLDVVGDGPLRTEWQELADKLGLGADVSFHGARPQSEVARHMARCHVFCLPSVRESGGAVLLEAMACARPVLALDFGGPAETVDADVGALVPMHDPAQVTTSLAFTLLDVCANPESWRRRGLNGRLRVERQHSWPAKISAAATLYDEVIDQRRPACHPA